jgi:K319-like protein
VTLPNAASLNGSVSDDGLPNPPGAVTTTWSVVSGPGTVTFGDAGAVVTTASFSAAGTYVLRLTASDSVLSSSDDATVTVNTGGQGTLSVIKKGAIHSATDASSYSFASVTAGNGLLYVVFVSTSIGSGTAPSATSVSGAGLTFTEVGTSGGLLYSGSVRRVQAWRALVSAGATTGSIAITLNGTSTSMDAVLLEFAGADTSGTNGSGAVVQSAGKAGSGTSLALTLSAFGSSNNRPVAFFSHRATEATTENPGYTELDDGSHGSPAAGAECEWNASTPDTTPSASWSTSSNAGGFAIEIKAAP